MMNFLSFTVMAWYVVHVGRRTGLFYCWEDCHAQINGFSGACYKRYNSKEEAITALKRQEQYMGCCNIYSGCSDYSSGIIDIDISVQIDVITR